MSSDGRLRVVLIEGHEDSRETLAMALEISGFEVRKFASPADALVAIEYDAPHVVVTSIVLSGIRGDELARALRVSPLRARPAIVATTGGPEEALATGDLFDRVFTKPLDVDQFVVDLRDLARRAAGEV